MSEDFIRVYDDFVDQNYCEKIINYFEWCSTKNRTHGRTSSKIAKEDESLALNYEMSFNRDNLPYVQDFSEKFFDVAYREYVKEFPILDDFERHKIFTYKVQKTVPGSGYHVWHSESGSREFGTRIGVYILYLNDAISGGETEFLYQKSRIEPVTGRLVIFPSCYTHVHRGNPPLSGDKYLMTGWIEYC